MCLRSNFCLVPVTKWCLGVFAELGWVSCAGQRWQSRRSGLCCPLQIYTRSVIDPIPAPAGDTCADSASKAGDKQKKKTKMSDEDIMEKLRRCLHFR